MITEDYEPAILVGHLADKTCQREKIQPNQLNLQANQGSSIKLKACP